MPRTHRDHRRSTVLATALLLGLATAACGSDAAGPSAAPTSSVDGGRLTRITDPPGAAVGPPLGTALDGSDVRVVDVTRFCDGYDRFQTYRTTFTSQLSAATSAGSVDTWVQANSEAGIDAATEMQRALGVSSGDVGMLPWTFVVGTEDDAYEGRDLDERRAWLAGAAERLAPFDAAAAELC